MKRLDAPSPLGRTADPAEIGSVIAFLAGDGASYLEATTIFAGGGLIHSSRGL
jgi:glucose 1-dehydrogenase